MTERCTSPSCWCRSREGRVIPSTGERYFIRQLGADRFSFAIVGAETHPSIFHPAAPVAGPVNHAQEGAP